MGAPYTSVTVVNYNANPPPDDGTQTEANRVKWATGKTKLSDPLKTALETINSNITAAFGKVLGGGGVTSTAISYTVLSSDQGKLVRATAAGITLTTPDATSVTSPFVFAVLNNSNGGITIDGSGAQTVDGAANIALPANQGATFFTDGTNWYSSGRAAEFAAGTRMPFQQTAAPTGWTKDTTHNDKALRVVSGSVVNGGAVAFSTVFAASGRPAGSNAASNVSYSIPREGYSTGSANPSSSAGFLVAGSGSGSLGSAFTHVSSDLGLVSTNGATAQAWTATAGTMNVFFVDLIIAAKD